ncbi:hypothetical protein OIT44_04230 [Weissella ceti]|uniref:Uncharacterized protein n=1 Tax=Weissella ceti TaxID=759620 RepID=A0ABT3E4D5_9LACO|nr:hypothetical protein [Weissella ceti]MCW0953283.1 hypothetical protein [Weissella ceti]QVK11392.1 hypothetical protein KHQ31_03985 [Weissella ceti]
MLLFVLGVILLVASIVAVAKVNNKMQKNVFIGGIITGIVMIGLGFSAFTPAEDSDKLLDEMLSSEKASRNSEIIRSDVHYEHESQTSESENINDSFNSDYEIESFLKENTKYTDISVSGTYINKPFGAVVTVNVNDAENKAQVVSKVLQAFHENANDRLKNFKGITIMVDDKNKRLKAEYTVDTVINNASVYRPSETQSLAKSWSVVPSPNK